MLFRIEFKPEIPRYYCCVSSGRGCSGHFNKLEERNDAFVLQQLLLGLGSFGCCEDAPEESFGCESQPQLMGILL